MLYWFPAMNEPVCCWWQVMYRCTVLTRSQTDNCSYLHWRSRLCI